ncbi:MAG: HAD family acid phosphatase [Ignavibacteriaceae bacterium]
MRKTIAPFLSFCFMILLTGCSRAPLNLEIAKDDVMNYYDSGKYDAELDNVVNHAESEFNNIQPGDSTVVIFDIDETILSSYNFEKELDFGYVMPLWNKFISEAKEPAIKQTKSLYDFLLKKDFKIIFLTGRNYDQYKSTYQNLLNDGFTKFDTLIVRQPKEYDLTALKYKSLQRTKLTNRGYKIAGTVGDQYSDLDGPYHGIQVKIPNYLYIIK